MTTPLLVAHTPQGPRITDLATPILRADDQGATRGDGAFETMHVRGETAWLLDAHIDRLVNSVSRLDIQPPSREVLYELVNLALTSWSQEPRPEAGIKLVVTRGAEFTARAEPTVYALIFPVAESAVKLRSQGIRLASLSYGYSRDALAAAPWLLGGVKCLSFAIHMAAVREAQRRQADDALLLAAEGTILEATTAAVIWLRDNQLHIVPTDTGILPSVTVSHLAEQAEAVGIHVRETYGMTRDLVVSEGAWLCSSVRGIVPVVSVDDTLVPVNDAFTKTLRLMAGFLRESAEPEEAEQKDGA